MATLLQTSDFAIGEYKIPNQEEVDLSTFITANQARILKELLGIDFYTEFIAGLDETEVDQKWTDLKDGKNFTYDNRTYRFEGIIDLLKPRLFSAWILYRAQKLAGAGVVSTTPANTTMESPARMIGRYNTEYFKKAGDWYDHENTLYGFLYANRDTYTLWDSTRWNPGWRINLLGL